MHSISDTATLILIVTKYIVVVFLLSTVTFTYEEPISGWVTTLKSVPGLCLGIGLGAIHVVYVNKNISAEIVPADKVANMIITSAWHASKTRYIFKNIRNIR